MKKRLKSKHKNSKIIATSLLAEHYGETLRHLGLQRAIVLQG